MNNITLIVTCTFGLESLVKNEILDMGFTDLIVSDGKIEFGATLADIPRLNIHLRCADRVLLKLAEYSAKDFDQLFDEAKKVAWDEWIPQDAKITVIGKSVKSALMSVRTCQSMIKKVIVEHFKGKYKISHLNESGHEFTVQVALFKDVAQLTLDTTGAGLNKRNYRIGVGEAPIRENLAAALVLLSNWRKDTILVDPMCGSGTILIEAALMARRIAPGLRRNFASEAWPCLNKESWESVRNAAKAMILPSGGLKIRGYDNDPQRVKDGVANARRAGVESDIVFDIKDVAELVLIEEKGVIVTNPPYGMNIGELDELPALYGFINALLEHKKGWSLFLLSADKTFQYSFKRARPDKIRKLFNGNIEVQFFQYVS